MRGPSTRSVHAGEARDKYAGSLIHPIAQTATYVFDTLGDFEAFKAGECHSFEYGRYGNPTQEAAENKIAALEGAERGLLFSSGMSAVTSALLALLEQGQHMVILGDCYRMTVRFSSLIAKFGIRSSTVQAWDWEELERVIKPETALLLTESPTNPHLRVVDLDRIVSIARNCGAYVLVDSTFATPINLRPLEHGVDLVIHSATKYLGGHNDLVAGGVFGSSELVGHIHEFQRVTGSITDPFTAFLLIRGLKTLALRVQRQNTNAAAIAAFLEAHPRVRRVYYPGLGSHPDHEVARRQMSGFGGVVSFEVDGDLETTRGVVDSLRIPYLAPSLGGVESLATHPATMSFYGLSREERLRAGIADQLVRYAAGIEDSAELLEDLEQALTRG